MTSITINVPNNKVSFFKKLMAEMGWSYEVKAKTKKTRLYDPVSGESLNDKTIKAIEDVRSGKEPVYDIKSMDEFKTWCQEL